MSTQSTTAIIDRRTQGLEPRTVAAWFRHHDGYPAGNGANLVKLIVEGEYRTPETLAAAINQQWTMEGRELGSNVPFYEPRNDHDSYQFRYDVIYELQGEKTVCRVECWTRDWDADGHYAPESSSVWLAQAEILKAAVADWPEPALKPHPRQRLSDLSEPDGLTLPPHHPSPTFSPTASAEAR